MGLYQLQTLLLKLLAVFFILAILAGSRRRNVFSAIISVVIISIAVHTLRDGINGLYFSISGISISFFLTIPIHISSETGKSRFVYSAAAGAITGPLGSLLVFTIFFFFLAVYRIFKSQQMIFSDIPPMMAPVQPPGFGEENLKSQIARIEASKMDAESNYAFNAQSLGKNQEASNIGAGPWKTILAMSTLAVIITGIFI